MARVLIGTSGWSYEHWNKRFYPSKLHQSEHFAYYAQFFDTVEINSTFYHLPLPTTVKHWREEAPKNFLFSVKASRFITHQKRLLDPQSTLKNFYNRVELLREKLGPILFQLPTSFKKNEERLTDFLKHIKKEHETVFEFRNPSWFSDEIFDLLKKNNIALCFSDMKGAVSPHVETGKFIYIRLHGPHHTYGGKYGKKRLQEWREKIDHWSKKKRVFVYFNNDERAFAVRDAQMLQEFK